MSYHHSKESSNQNQPHLSENSKQVYNLYFDKIFLFLVGKVKNTIIAEDLAHKVFDKFIKRKKQTEIHNIEGYLFTTARNVIKDYFKKKKVWTVQLDKVEHYHFVLPNQEQETQEENDRFHKQLRQACVHTTLDCLSEKEKNALILRHEKGLRISEIQQKMNLSDGALRGVLYRAKKKFQEVFQREFSRQLA